jgi:DNA-binding Lrp family transcriptional regulator
MSYKFDEIDLKIMKSLSDDCRKSTTQIAKEAGISRPTAIARMKRLVENQLIDLGAKVNVINMGVKMALLNLETDTIEAKQEILSKLKACPRVLQLIQAIEKPCYVALVSAENAETLLSTIECLRDVLNARIVSWQRAKPIIGESFDLKILLEKCDLTPCGKKCGICSNYQELECVGCPATKDYKGPL